MPYDTDDRHGIIRRTGSRQPTGAGRIPSPREPRGNYFLWIIITVFIIVAAAIFLTSSNNSEQAQPPVQQPSALTATNNQNSNQPSTMSVDNATINDSIRKDTAQVKVSETIAALTPFRSTDSVNSDTEKASGNKSPNTFTILQENFIDDRNLWAVETNLNFSFSIEDSLYKMVNHTSREFHSTLEFNRLNPNNDYGISTTLMNLSGNLDEGYGVVFNLINQLNFYVFAISGNGYYCVFREKDGSYISIIPWKYSDRIHRGAGQWNMIAILKKGNDFVFRINFTLVDTLYNFGGDRGNGIGFTIGRMQFIEAKNIIIIQSEN